jgi:transcriptional regulator with XRE-family HTH domain
MSRVGEYLKKVREERGISQSEVSKHLGLTSPQYVSNAERGKCHLSHENALKICEFIGANKNVLFRAYLQDYKDKLEIAFGIEANSNKKDVCNGSK